MSCDYDPEEKQNARKEREALLRAKMMKQMTDRFVQENTPMCYPPKPTHIAVRRALGIAVYGFIRYPMPNGKFETTYERIA